MFFRPVTTAVLSLLVTVSVSGIVLSEPLLSASEVAKLSADDGEVGDIFGGSVAIDGNTLVAGARQDDGLVNTDQGAAYVFVHDGTSWLQQAKLTPSDAAFSDFFGSTVGIDGETIVVGAEGDDDGGSFSGAAYVFVRSGSSWFEQAKLTASDASTGQLLGGHSISIDGDTVVVSAEGDDHAGTSSGAAYVFVRSGSSWSQQAKLTASDAMSFDLFGHSVAIDRDTIVAGARFDDDGGDKAGAAYVFVRNGSSWFEQAKLTASDAASGQLFGTSVAIDGETILIAADTEFVAGGFGVGGAYVFVRSGVTWTEQAKLVASDVEASDQFGNSVAISGNAAVVAARFDDHSLLSDAGSAYVFLRDGTSWFEKTKLTASDAANGDLFGNSSFSIHESTIGIGSRTAPLCCAGDVYVYELLGSDLVLTKTDSADPVVEDGRITYNISVSNNGPEQATGVTLTDTLPVGAILVTAEPSQGAPCTEDIGNITCELGSMDSGASATVTIVVNGITPGTITNSANVVGNQFDPVPSNNADSEDTEILADADGDGMPDAFETANGLNPLNPADASGDLDGDGFTNLQEFKAGTDPNDPGSNAATVLVPILQILIDE